MEKFRRKRDFEKRADSKLNANLNVLAFWAGSGVDQFADYGQRQPNLVI